HVQDGGSTISSNGGTISITGTAGNTSSLAIEINHSGAVSSATNADLTLIADSIDIENGTATPGSVSAGSGIANLNQKTAGPLINLGGADVLAGTPLTLGLTAAEISRVTAGTINFGNANSGNITVSDALTRSSATNLTITSSGSITVNQPIDANGGTTTL